jgi:hypothetical protein
MSAASAAWYEQQERFDGLRQMGMVLYGTGHDAEWFAAMDREGMLYLVHSAGDTIRIGGVERLEPMDIDAVVYAAENASGRLTFMVFGDSCSAGYPNSIQVSYVAVGEAPTTYQGCAMYLNPPVLHDIWALKSWNRYRGISMKPGRGGPVQHPYMELHLHNSTFMAHTGCHTIRGALSAQGRWLRFRSNSLAANDCAWEAGVVLESLLQGSLFEYSMHLGALHLVCDSDTLVFNKVH